MEEGSNVQIYDLNPSERHNQAAMHFWMMGEEEINVRCH